jgi:hypothetical protein
MKKTLSLALSFTINSLGLFALAARPALARQVASAQASGIEITSPESDKTVGVGQVEVEVKVNDEDVNNLMVAVYTQDGGPKPVTARLYDLLRSDHSRKTIPLKLVAGVNRIEVSDPKRSELKATRTLTYVPARNILSAAPQDNGDAAGGAARESIFARDLADAGANNKAVICGQLQLASLNRTLALIRSTPTLGDLAARFRPAVKDPRTGKPADPRRRYEDQIEAGEKEGPDFLIASQLNDRCELQTGLVPSDGLQKSAAIDLLRAVLLRLNSNLQPKNIPVNAVAVENETAYLLETTTTSKGVKAAARGSAPLAARGKSATDEFRVRQPLGGHHQEADKYARRTPRQRRGSVDRRRQCRGSDPHRP